MKPSGTPPGREPRSTGQPVAVTPSDVVFISGGVTCAADLYRPDGPAGSLPCLVMGHGFSGTKGLARVYAERFAAAGLAVLVFDYRHFGASGGEPRQLVDVDKQRADYHAAVHYARTVPGIDPERIALWGTSFSGGHVIAVAAEAPRIAAVVAQVPLLDARRTGRTTRQRLRRALSRSVLKLFAAAGRDAMRAVRSRPPYLVRVVGRPGEAAVYTEPQVAAIFAELGGEAAGWRNAFAPRFLFGLPRYRPGTVERLQMPLLVCVADHDLEASPDFAVEVAKRAPRAEVRRYPVGHFDVYAEPVRTQMIGDQIAFLRTHLQVPAPDLSPR
jgi:dienelactone hydrolase